MATLWWCGAAYCRNHTEPCLAHGHVLCDVGGCGWGRRLLRKPMRHAELLLERCLIGFLLIGLIHLLLRAGAVLTTALESAPKIIGPLVLRALLGGEENC